MSRIAVRSVVIAALVQCVVAGGSDGPTGTTGASLSIVAGGSATDTVLTALPQALVVEVHNEHGDIEPGVVVRFQVLADPDSPLPSWQQDPLFIGQIDSPNYGDFAIDSTDQNGRARVVVKLGRLAGSERLAISVPEFGLTDTSTYEVLPGQAVGVNVSPADTVLLPGSNAQLRAQVVDAFGNDRSADVPTYAAGTANIAVGESGAVEAKTAGRAYVIVSAGKIADTAWVSVVPAGAFVAYTNGLPGGALGVITMNNDGSGYKLIAGLSTYNFNDGAGPAFSPDHKTVIFFNDVGAGASTRLYLADVATGAVTRATPDDGNAIVREEWGRYSADGQWLLVRGPQGLEFVSVDDGEYLPLAFARTFYHPATMR